MSEGSGSSNARHDLFGIHLKADELAARMGGGLPRGSTMLIEGAEGSGRSAMCQRLLYGLLQNGHSATFVSTELTLRVLTVSSLPWMTPSPFWSTKVYWVLNARTVGPIFSSTMIPVTVLGVRHSVRRSTLFWA